MIDPTMDIPMEELELILGGLSEDGSISKEAEQAIQARIDQGRSMGLPMSEVKRQLRARLDAEPGVAVTAAVEKLWKKSL